jgi:hypothetical protein
MVLDCKDSKKRNGSCEKHFCTVNNRKVICKVVPQEVESKNKRVPTIAADSESGFESR